LLNSAAVARTRYIADVATSRVFTPPPDKRDPRATFARRFHTPRDLSNDQLFGGDVYDRNDSRFDHIPKAMAATFQPKWDLTMMTPRWHSVVESSGQRSSRSGNAEETFLETMTPRRQSSDGFMTAQRSAAMRGNTHSSSTKRLLANATDLFDRHTPGAATPRQRSQEPSLAGEHHWMGHPLAERAHSAQPVLGNRRRHSSRDSLASSRASSRASSCRSNGSCESVDSRHRSRSRGHSTPAPSRAGLPAGCAPPLVETLVNPFSGGKRCAAPPPTTAHGSVPGLLGHDAHGAFKQNQQKTPRPRRDDAAAAIAAVASGRAAKALITGDSDSAPSTIRKEPQQRSLSASATPRLQQHRSPRELRDLAASKGRAPPPVDAGPRSLAAAARSSKDALYQGKGQSWATSSTRSSSAAGRAPSVGRSPLRGPPGHTPGHSAPGSGMPCSAAMGPKPSLRRHSSIGNLASRAPPQHDRGIAVQRVFGAGGKRRNGLTEQGVPLLERTHGGIARGVQDFARTPAEHWSAKVGTDHRGAASAARQLSAKDVREQMLRSTVLQDAGVYQKADQTKHWEVAELKLQGLPAQATDSSLTRICKAFGHQVVRVSTDNDPVTGRCNGFAKIMLRSCMDTSSTPDLVQFLKEKAHCEVSL